MYSRGLTIREGGLYMTNSVIDSQYNMACHFLEAQKLPSLKICLISDVICPSSWKIHFNFEHSFRSLFLYSLTISNLESTLV